MRIKEAHACDARHFGVIVDDEVHSNPLLPVPDTAKQKVKLM